MHQEKQLHVEHCSDACKKWLCGLETFLQNRQGHLKRVDRVVTACNLALEQRPQRLKVPQLSFMGGGFKRPHLLADHFLVLQVAPWCWACHGHQANLAQPQQPCFQRAVQNADFPDMHLVPGSFLCVGSCNISHRLACEA